LALDIGGAADWIIFSAVIISLGSDWGATGPVVVIDDVFSPISVITRYASLKLTISNTPLSLSAFASILSCELAQKETKLIHAAIIIKTFLFIVFVFYALCRAVNIYFATKIRE
jgi:hypothetical protein